LTNSGKKDRLDTSKNGNKYDELGMESGKVRKCHASPLKKP